jgi:hypothetical protein
MAVELAARTRLTRDDQVGFVTGQDMFDDR